MQDIIMGTEGVRLAPLSAGDLPLLAELHADPAVNRFISAEQGSWNLDKVSSFLDNTLSDQERHGFSTFKVMGNDKTLLGWAGFSALEETSEIALRSCYSAKALKEIPGLAVMVGTDLIDWFFDNTYFSHMVLPVRTDDREGRAIARALNFVYRESCRIGDMPCDVFQLLSPSMRSYVMSA